MGAVRGLEAACGGRHADHPPAAHRLDDAFEGMGSQILEIEGAADQAPGRGGDDDIVGLRQPLQACGEIGRLAHRQLRHRGIATAGLADHYRPGGDADSDLERGPRLDRLHRLDDLEPSPQRPLGIVLVSLRPAEIGHQTVAQILRDMALVALDDRPAGALIRLHEASQVLGIELLGQRRRAHQVAEHHRDLAALEGRRPPEGWERRCEISPR